MMSESMVHEIDLKENAVYAVVDGNITKITAMENGNDEIVWKNGRVLDVVRSHRIRVGTKKEIG